MDPQIHKELGFVSDWNPPNIQQMFFIHLQSKGEALLKNN